ncbi:MAG TPA: transporter substrate-binding domain-containing protein [Candidatus Acidoferrum sp.]|nr:transporter substrate-binding domain-containing protein [Candidatus Acidoferrum sp.]
MTKNPSSLLALLFVLGGWCVPGSLAADAAPLKIGVTPVFPPVIYEEGGKITGVETDFAKALGEALGRPVELVEVKWEDQIPALVDGRTDIIMSGMSVTHARELRIAFSKPYLIVGQMALVRRADAYKYALGFPGNPSGAIGVVKATTGDFLVQQEFSSNKRKEYKSGPDAAKALIKGRIDLFICDAPTIWWLAGLHETDNLVAVPVFLSQEPLAWGVRRSDTDLLNAVNAALEKLQASGRANQIIKHWIPLFQPQSGTKQ